MEKAPAVVRKILVDHDNWGHKVSMWNAFVDTGLTGISEDDCAILPRILPGSYLPIIESTARDIATFALRLLSLPDQELKAILPSGPIRDFLINELGVLRHRQNRITGSFRFDMAIVDEATKLNPPRLLEINEIGFDGLARSSKIQETILRLLPDLSRKVIALDTARAEARNMKRLGTDLTRFQFDNYNWEEEVLVQKAKEQGLAVSLVSPRQFGCEMDVDLPLLTQQTISIHNGRVRVGPTHKPDALQMGFSFELNDYQESESFYGNIVKSKTPQYGPFLTGLVASKMILVLLSDKTLRKRILGNSEKLKNVILPATPLAGHDQETRKRPSRYVLKHTDGLGGEQVFIGPELLRKLKQIPARQYNEWVVQERTKLNVIDVHGILSRPRRVLSDLGVFVQYDWAKGQFLNFEVGGFITRATNRSYKVNVSGGGIQVPVMFTRNS